MKPPGHRVLRTKAAVLLSLALCFAQSAATPLSNDWDRSRSLEELRREWAQGAVAVAASPGGCMLGLQLDESSARIIGMGPPLAGTSISAGDTLVAIDSRRIKSAVDLGEIVTTLPAGSMVAITFESAGVTREARVRCADRAKWRAKLLEALNLAIGGQYRRCLNSTLELDRIAGPRTGHAKLRFECAEAERIVLGRTRGYASAQQYYEYHRRLVAPARYSGEYRASIRGKVLSAIENLRKDEFTGLAADLEALYALSAGSPRDVQQAW